MFKTFRQRVLMAALMVAAVFAATALLASSGTAEDEVRNEVRMTVDYTVLPLLKAEETEPVAPEPAAPPTAPPSAPEPAETAAAPEPAPEPKTEPAPAAKPAPMKGPGQVASISLKETAQGFTLTIATDRPVTETTYMNLANPRRLVLDLKGRWSYLAGNVIRSEAMVKHIVIGEHPDRLRLVVHYRTPPTGNVKPEFTSDGNRLSISVPRQ